MKALTIEQILAAKDAAVAKVPCPEWGGDVYLRPLSGNGRDWIDATFAGHNGDPQRLKGMRAEVVARSLCDEDGNAQNVTALQVLELGEKSGKALDRCYAKCVELSGLGAQAVEDAAGN